MSRPCGKAPQTQPERFLLPQGVPSLETLSKMAEALTGRPATPVELQWAHRRLSSLAEMQADGYGDTYTCGYLFGFAEPIRQRDEDLPALALPKLDLTPIYGLAVRGELFGDPSGARTGTAQRLSDLTVTPSMKLGKHLVMRGDPRFDRSSVSVFETRNGVSSHQMTAAQNALLVY